MSLCKKIGEAAFPFTTGNGVYVEAGAGNKKELLFTRLTNEVGGLSLLKASRSSALFLFSLSEQQKNSENKLQLHCTASFTTILPQSQVRLLFSIYLCEQ